MKGSLDETRVSESRVSTKQTNCMDETGDQNIELHSTDECLHNKGNLKTNSLKEDCKNKIRKEKSKQQKVGETLVTYLSGLNMVSMYVQQNITIGVKLIR